MNKCGVCNKEVPIDHTQLGKIETDGTLTSYHMRCEYAASKVKPCGDCGYHRLFCDACAEPELEANQDE